MNCSQKVDDSGSRLTQVSTGWPSDLRLESIESAGWPWQRTVPHVRSVYQARSQ